ncbi:MAG TPA: flagellar protein FlaG [Symbiobacteriaceae bacterium]|nr:flagellar protein FlaG [Symbiobacteriaceae bacterium]
MQVRPTPIVSSGARSQPSRVVGAPVTPTAQVAAAVDPMVIDLPNSDSVIEVQAGELPKIVEQMNKAIQAFSNSIRFEVHEDHRIVIRVIDTTSGEIVREIPPEKLLDTFNRMEDLVGLLLDQRL